MNRVAFYRSQGYLFFLPCDFPFPALPWPRTLLDTFLPVLGVGMVMVLGMILDFDVIKYNFFNHLYASGT